jgi:hypothetical protein
MNTNKIIKIWAYVVTFLLACCIIYGITDAIIYNKKDTWLMMHKGAVVSSACWFAFMLFLNMAFQFCKEQGRKRWGDTYTQYWIGINASAIGNDFCGLHCAGRPDHRCFSSCLSHSICISKCPDVTKTEKRERADS